MKIRIVLPLLLFISTQWRTVHSQYPFLYTTPNHPTRANEFKSVYPAAPLHYVNIGHELAGDYKFGYDTGKGPLGQSFREEIRLVDGTIKGLYGLVDELGHKRVVHYTAGKSGFIAQEDSDSRSMEEPVSSTPRPQPRFVEHPNLHNIPRQVTVPLSTFELADYQRTKTTVPVLRQQSLMDHQSFDAPRVLTPVQSDYDVPASARNDAVPSVELLKSYVESKVPRRTKTGKRVKSRSNIQERKSINKARSYVPSIEDEYYDTIPAFIDIERLSYNIGTNKNGRNKINQ